MKLSDYLKNWDRLEDQIIEWNKEAIDIQIFDYFSSRWEEVRMWKGR